MAFHIHSLFIYTTLVLLSLYHVNASTAIHWPKKSPPSLGFSWKNCGPGSDPVQVKSLNVSPDPLVVPGNLTLALVFSLGSASPTDIHVSVTMEKKVAGFYVTIPCIDNVGSCNYGGLCEAWASACPKYFEKYGIPCTCPIPANTYSVPDAVIGISGKLPSIVDGQFRLTGDIGSNAGHLGCIQLEIGLKSG